MLTPYDPANYEATVGDALLDGSVIGRPDLYDAVYALCVSGALDRILAADVPAVDAIAAALWREATVCEDQA